MEPTTSTRTIGIIAGNGRFPLLAATEARKQGYRVIICGLEGEADEALQNIADGWKRIKIGELRKLVDFFRTHNVTNAIMAGKVEKVRLFSGHVRPDLDMIRMLMKTRDFKDDSLLGGIANYLDEQGITLLDSTLFVKHAFPGSGPLGRCRPSREVLDDIRFGFELAKVVSGADVGQTVVVKKKAVMAIEAIEGTDEAIRRGGLLGSGEIVAVKVSKPNQDMRFDVPAVGLGTLRALEEAKARAFAFEAGKTLFIDRDAFVSAADRIGLVVYGWEAAES